MKENVTMAGISLKGWFAIAAGGYFLFGCGEGDDLIKKKLEIILASDLNSLTAGVAKSGLADSAYYIVVSYKSFKEGMYSKLAVVEFYFLKTVKAKVIQKYRYFTGTRQWDRYFNEYRFYGDSTTDTKPR